MRDPSQVAVVTDSTAYLPAALVAEQQLTVVPLQVVLGGRSLAEGTEVTSAEIAAALQATRQVTTSRPAPQLFAEVYRRLAAGGAPAVVSVHLSGELSGTVEAARAGAALVAAEGCPVEVVDSRSLGMGLGFAVLEAAAAVARGEGAASAARWALRRALGSSAWLYVDTLEFLRRGGRIGAAQAMLGSALAVKPLLVLLDGRLEPLDRVRTTSRALARLEEVVVAEVARVAGTAGPAGTVRDAGGGGVDIAVHHLASLSRAEDLAGRLRERLPGLASMTVSEVGAVVGAHVGPGMLGVVVAPRLQ